MHCTPDNRYTAWVSERSFYDPECSRHRYGNTDNFHQAQTWCPNFIGLQSGVSVYGSRIHMGDLEGNGSPAA
eukprot:5907040-Karenia_brevis.AAC.1